MINILDKHQCCGCEACVQICPKQCIKFYEDEEGFLYPLVDKEKCIDCDLCEKVCPFINTSETRKPRSVYAARNKNEEELLSSSSGGLYILFAKKVISLGGVVFGARFDEKWDVVHSFALTEEGIRMFQGSKYVQSRIGKTYIEVRDYLKKGKIVLFTGTSCQIAGLKSFLQKDYTNLFTIDVICHGVPSPMVWRRYLKELTSESGNDRIKTISFRDKKHGWKNYHFKLTFEKRIGNGNKQEESIFHLHREDTYMQLFLRNLILRPSCYNCPAKNGRCNSDLTIADFWGIEKNYPSLDDERGVGLLIVNSEKGSRLIDVSKLYLQEVTLTNGITNNQSYSFSVKEPEKRAQCFKIMNKSEDKLRKIITRLYYLPLHIRIKNKLRKIFNFIQGT